MGQAATIILFAICITLGIIVLYLNGKVKLLYSKVISLPDIPDEQGIAEKVLLSVSDRIPTLNSVLEVINKDISIKPKCPQCQGIIAKKSEFCGSCGFRLSTPKPPAVNARILDFEHDEEYDSDEPLCLDWQCSLCNTEQVDTFVEWDNSRKFIHLLECEECEELCADLLLNTEPYSERGELDTCIVQLAPHGALSISNLKS